MCVEAKLDALRREVRASLEKGLPAHLLSWFDFTITDSGAQAKFYGSPFDAPYAVALEGLSRSSIAEHLISLAFDGPDDGANGTQVWDLRSLANAHGFPRLRSFSVRQSRPDDHNISIIAGESFYNEDGTLTDILSKCPMLAELTSPSAPSRSFLEIPRSSLEHLNIDAGYDTEDFIANLSRSTVFPKLRSLAWGEYREKYMENWIDEVTPFDDVRDLLVSEAFASGRVFVWKNPPYENSRIATLKKLRPEITIKVIRFSGEYVG